MKVNNKKYLAARQLPRHNKALTQRTPLFLLPVLEPFLRNKREKMRVSLMAARRGKSTLDGWNRAIRRFLDFLDSNGENVFNLSENMFLDYLYCNEDKRTSHSVMSGTRAALQFLIKALKLPEVWSSDVDSCYLAILKRASAEKPRTRKAVPLDIRALRRASEVHIMPYLSDIEKVRVFLKFSLHSTNNYIRGSRGSYVEQKLFYQKRVLRLQWVNFLFSKYVKILVQYIYIYQICFITFCIKTFY